MPAVFRDRSLKTQIAVVFGTLVIVVVTGLTIVLGSMLSVRIRHDTEASLRLTADSIATTLQRNLAFRTKQVVVLGRSEALWAAGLDSAAARAALHRITDYQPDNRRSLTVDAQGRVQAAVPRHRIGQDVWGQDWFANGLQGASVGVLESVQAPFPRESRDPGESLLVFSAPAKVGERTVGVVAVQTSWDWMRAAIEQYLPPDAAELALDVVVFDRAGMLLHAVGPKAGELRNEHQGRPSAGSTASSVRWADGMSYLTAVSQVRAPPDGPDIGWIVAVRRPADLAYRDAQRAIATTLSIGLLAAIASAAIAFLAAGRISGDLSRLVEALRDVEQGVPGATIPSLDSSKETRTLSQALQRVTSRLLQGRQEMEAQVRLRTLELEAANRELDLQARSDPLTGLLNRRGLSDHLEPALALAARGERPLSIVVLDADHFKRINDRYGHVVGDDVLRHLASTLRHRLRTSDVASRVGGEEFLVLLPDTDLVGAEPLAQQLIEHVAARPHPVCGALTLSAGVASFRAGDDAQSLFRRADRALYAAKAAGRNRVRVAEPYDSDAIAG